MKIKKKILSTKFLAFFGFTLVAITLILILFAKKVKSKTKTNSVDSKIEKLQKVGSEMKQKPVLPEVSELSPKKILTGILLTLENDKDEKLIKRWEKNERYDYSAMIGIKTNSDSTYVPRGEKRRKFENSRKMLNDIMKEIYNEENKTLSELQKKFDEADYQPLEYMSLFGVELDPNMRKDLLTNYRKEISKELMSYKGGRYKDYVVIDSDGDGSCMLHSVATMLTGNNGTEEDPRGVDMYYKLRDADRLRSAVIIYVVMYCNDDINLREVMGITEDDEQNLENVKDFLKDMNIFVPDENNLCRDERVYLTFFFHIIGTILKRSIIWISESETVGFTEYVFFANKTIDKDNEPWIFFLDKEGHSQTLIPKSIVEK